MAWRQGERGRLVTRGSGAALLLCAAVAVVALTWPLGTAAAATQTWTYVQGVGGYPFELEPGTDGAFGTGLTVVDGAGGQTVRFQLGAADVQSVAPAAQVTDTASTLPFDILLSGISGVRKTYFDLGGTLDLGGNSAVKVSLSYSVGDGTSPVQTWQLAGPPADETLNGTFDFALSGDPVGKTIAYQVTITAPAVVMTTPVVISDITISYGAYAAPKPKPKPSTRPSTRPSRRPTATAKPSDAGGSGGQGSDTGAGATHTGNGAGTGAGNGSGAGNVSGGAAHTSPASSRPAQARATTTVALPPSSTTGPSASVSGYALAPSRVAAPASTIEGNAVRTSGGHAPGTGADTSNDLAYVVLGALAILAIALPWPLASRRLRALAAFDHDPLAAPRQAEEWLVERSPD